MARDEDAKFITETLSRLKPIQYGEMEPSGYFSPFKNRARVDFLEKISVNTRLVLYELGAAPFSLYQQHGDLIASVCEGDDQIRQEVIKVAADPQKKLRPKRPFPYWKVLEIVAAVEPKLVEVRDSIIEWAGKFNLLYETKTEYATWMLNTALATLESWRMSPSGVHGYLWSTIDLWQQEWLPAPRFQFDVEGWLIEDLDREEFERIVRWQLDKHLRAYCEAQERAALNAGYVRNQKHRTSRWEGFHMIWFIKYQVGGMSLAEIAAEFRPYAEGGTNLAAATVKKAIEAMADLVGLKLRPKGEPGRPKKLK